MEFSFGKHKNSNKSTVIYFLSEDLKLPKLLKDLNKENIITSIIQNDTCFKGKFGQFLLIHTPKTTGAKMLILAGLGKKESINELSLLNLGGKIADKANALKISSLDLVVDKIDGVKLEIANIANYLALGIKLKNYSFNKYFVAKKDEHQLPLQKVTFSLDAPDTAQKLFGSTNKVADGVLLTRNLVSEPPNVLYPESFAKRCLDLKKLGVKITILNTKEMKKLGMGALLGVGQGSINEPKTVLMEWNGAKSKTKSPIAFIGKGVTFDTGGINLKPSSNIADMKYDMGGAGVVTGLMHALASRKAKVNIIGAIGLVENMPSGSAQRPSDVVTSMSGQTIEVDNTDAEGRLVLADVLYYVQKVYKPKFMIDLATLTGAIVIALGDAHAGLFSNCDELANQIIAASKQTGELVWRMPLSDHYDKQINSEIADVRNTGTGTGGGSITAAQFLQRFVNQCTWAHIDIAGMAWNKKGTDIIPKGATGFGVRLLNQLIYDNYED
jgi:leucyl aminopeptidase